MKVSAIIPTLNSAGRLPELLKGLSGQALKCSEVIVIDSGSSDDTVQIAKDFGAKVLVIPKNSFDHGGTRTLAGRRASGEILLYMTPDALPADDHAIANLVRPLHDGKVGAAFGRQLPSPGANPLSAHLRYFNYPGRSYARGYADRKKFGLKTAFLSNSFCAYKRAALEEIGWFKDRLIGTEDTYAGASLLKAGYHLAYAADALVYHSHNYTTLQEARRYFDIGVFHRCEDWILREFGEAGGEGMRFIKSQISYLAKNKKIHLLTEAVLRNCFRFVFYKLGLNYAKIPAGIRPLFSMNRAWWGGKGFSRNSD